MPKVAPLEEERKDFLYSPAGQELEIQGFLADRIDQLKDFRKQEMVGTKRSIESIWTDADNEYTPHDLDATASRKRFESNEETGLRSRLVKIGGNEDWQSNNACPDFYVKVNTALAILVNQNPEAVFMAASSRYEENTLIAYNNWKASWEESGAKQQLKHFIFNMAKYGTGFARTYPRLIEQQKRVRTEYYPNEPDRDRFEEKRLVKYNGLYRENLNPWQVWVSSQARVGDANSVEDWYFEKEYSWESFLETFRDYGNVKYAKRDQSSGGEEGKPATTGRHEDKITVGFYENQVKDLYVIWLPETKVVLYYSPLPNDEGKLSLWFAPWTLRDDRLIWGIGIYEIIREDSILYDKLANMTMDQLVLSIYKMFFYKGTDLLPENDKIVVAPGEGRQVSDPMSVRWLEIPGAGKEAWVGLEFLQTKKDINSGVTPQLFAQFSGKTLGQDLSAKEAALERMKTSLDYICDALQLEAEISLSWLKQILSTPEVLTYSRPEDLALALKEAGLSEQDIRVYLAEAENPTGNGLLFQEDTGEMEKNPVLGPEGKPIIGENGEIVTREMPVMAKKANVYPEQRYGIAEDDKGTLMESEQTRFYRFGVHFGLDRLDWKGMIRIKPQSVLAPSKELVKRMKLDMFNLVYPAIQTMISMPQYIPVLMPPIKQIIKIHDEDIKDWIDEQFLGKLYEQSLQPGVDRSDKEKVNMSIGFDMLPFKTQAEIMDRYYGVKMEQPLFIDKNQMQGGKPGQVKPPKPGERVKRDGTTPLGKPGNLATKMKPIVPRDTLRPSQSDVNMIKGVEGRGARL